MKKNDFHILVNSSEFMDDLEERIGSAKTRVLVQAMTFEADEAGMRLYNALKNSSAQEKILCVDAYSLVNINDGWAYGWRYLTNSIHRKEVDDTRRLLKSSGRFGIRIVITNPVGFLGLRYPFRNHKKIIVVDDVAYLGGVNFSDHNFEWHDFMVRFSNITAVERISIDFENTCQKRNQSKIIGLGEDHLYFLDGNNSKEEYEKLFAELASAEKSITVLSPYVSDPLLSKLNKLGEDIEVKIVTPEMNNKSLLKYALFDRIKRMNVQLFEYRGGMSHLKAILIDDSKLIFGSSNFDVVSYYLEQEVIMISEDVNLIQSFKSKILKPDLAQSRSIDLANAVNHLRARVIMIFLKKSVAFLAFMFKKKDVRKTKV